MFALIFTLAAGWVFAAAASASRHRQAGPIARPAARKRPALRGYSLVEMSIVLAVMGLLLGGALLPFASRVRSENYREVDTAIEDARAAVVAYAMRNRTVARALEVGGRDEYIPAGRPYLPCPDIDGDGVEDRNDEDDVLEAMSDSVYDSFTGTADEPLVMSTSASDDNRLLAAGVCDAHKGVLPWITLGIPPADRWGNRFTYRVDPAFSSSALGFDEISRADVLDLRLPVAMMVTGADAYLTYARRGGADDQQPTLICNGTADCSPASVDDGVVAGVVTGGAIAAHRQNPRAYGADDIVDGIPFVIVSHGQNGAGAVNHHSSDAAGIFCNFRPDGDDERQNANREVVGGFTIANRCAIPDVSGVARAHFVSLPRHRGDDAEFDDIVVWMSASELIGELARNGVLPVENLPY